MMFFTIVGILFCGFVVLGTICAIYVKMTDSRIQEPSWNTDITVRLKETKHVD